jgi:hypothetical protein
VKFLGLTLLLLPFLFCSCQQKIEDEHEYLLWINDPGHGLVKRREVGDLIVQAKYLPSDLLAWKELNHQKISDKEKDSLSRFYDQSLTFLLSVSPDSSKGATDDILYRGVSNQKDFKRRVNELNFGIEGMIKLLIAGKEYYPVLAVMENTYGTSSSKNFYIVFSSDDKKKIGKAWEEADLVFSDEIFETGINHFIFKREAIENIPVFNFRTSKK